MPSGRYSRAARSEESELSDDEDGPDDSAQQTAQYLARESSRRKTYIVLAGVILVVAGIVVAGVFIGRHYWSKNDSEPDVGSTIKPSGTVATVTVEAPQSVKSNAVSAPAVLSEDDDETDTEQKTRSTSRHSSSEAYSLAPRPSKSLGYSSDADHAQTSSPSKPKPTGSRPLNNSSSTPDGAIPLNVDFTTFSGTDVEGFLTENGLAISKYDVASTPIPHVFLAENVDIVDGALRLKVDGDAKSTNVRSAEIATIAKDILYGSMTTRAKSTSVPGVCHGFFYYLNDDSEIDIEILTSYVTKGLENGIPPGLEFTNHGEGDKNTNAVWEFPWDPAEDFHDYTINWTEGKVAFLVDGDEVKVLETNVPTLPGAWIWNSWSSGEPQWSAGPPAQDNWLLIESITGYYTTA